MLRFRQFILFEGGNIQLGKKGEGGAQAAPFDSSKRETTAPDIHNALSVLHDKVHKQHGVHIFGKDKAALKNGTAFDAGSTKFLFDKTISHADYAKKIPKTGDVDTFVDEKHKDKLEHTLESMPAGMKLGNTTYLGWKKGGGESHVLLQHPEHEHPIQIDLNHGKYENENPTEGVRFSRTGGSLEDRANGIKGKHVNMLINAVAKSAGMKKGPKGLKMNDAPASEYGDQTPGGISKKLFGVEHEGIKSFSGTAKLIKEKIPKPKHKEIYDYFVGSLEKDSDGAAANKPAISALRNHLGIKV